MDNAIEDRLAHHIRRAGRRAPARSRRRAHQAEWHERLQRKLQVGYNIRAARIVETMEKRGLVGPSNGAKDREVLIDAL